MDSLTKPELLSQGAHDVIATGMSVLSIASYWEVVIKARKGLLPIADPVSWWERAASLLGGKAVNLDKTVSSALAFLNEGLHLERLARHSERLAGTLT